MLSKTESFRCSSSVEKPILNHQERASTSFTNKVRQAALPRIQSIQHAHFD